MKKADYQTLAAIIARRLATYEQHEAFRNRADEMRTLARELSKSLHVNPVAFLKACGID